MKIHNKLGKINTKIKFEYTFSQVNITFTLLLRTLFSKTKNHCNLTN